MPFNKLDIFVLIFVALFFFNGWHVGFFRAILGPISLTLAIIISMVYYAKEGNLLMAIVISVFGPFVIHIGLTILCRILNLTKGKDKELSPLSRILGGLFSSSWMGTMLLLIILMIAMVPAPFDWIKKAQNTIYDSTSYHLISKVIGRDLPKEQLSLETLSEIVKNPDAQKQLQETEEFQSIMDNEKVQNILEDNNILEMIQNKDFRGLMESEKIRDLTQDKNLMENMMNFQKVIMTETLNRTESSAE